MQLITPIIEDYRLKHRLRTVGCSYDGDKSKVIQQGFDQKVPSVGLPYYFKNDLSLDCDKVIITSVDILINTQVEKVDTQAGGNPTLDNLALDTLKRGYVVFQDHEQKIINLLPMYSLASEGNGLKPTNLWLDTQIWSNCYFIFDSITNVNATKGMVFRITYFDKLIGV